MAESTEMSNAKSLIDADIFDTSGERLGGVEDLVVDVHNGTVAFVVVSVGGMLGMGGKLYAVPWQAVRLQPDHRQFILDVTGDRWKNAPGFDKSSWPDMSSEEFRNQIYGYYGGTARYSHERAVAPLAQGAPAGMSPARTTIHSARSGTN